MSSGCLRAFGRPKEDWADREENKGFLCPQAVVNKVHVVALY